jgi:hypothetical protein
MSNYKTPVTITVRMCVWHPTRSNVCTHHKDHDVTRNVGCGIFSLTNRSRSSSSWMKGWKWKDESSSSTHRRRKSQLQTRKKSKKKLLLTNRVGCICVLVFHRDLWVSHRHHDAHPIIREEVLHFVITEDTSTHRVCMSVDRLMHCSWIIREQVLHLLILEYTRAGISTCHACMLF